MEVRKLTAEADRREAVPILRQLWPERAPDEVFDWTGEEGYVLFGAVVDGELVGVAGVLESGVLHHDRHAWLYDLVVDRPHRGRGYGAALVDAVEAWAAERGFDAIALASPTGKHGVHGFYADREYERWGYVIEKAL